jgi:hypothetical protein
MAEQSGTRIRVILKWLQILESLDTDEIGEFVFNFRVFTRNNGGQIQESRIPEGDGYIEITHNRSGNRLDHINKVLFDGYVEDHLKIIAEGMEVDQFSDNDYLDAYEREFTGPVSGIVGPHIPGDEGSVDPENMSNWRLAYTVEEV